MEDLDKNYKDVKKIFDSRTFKYEMLIAFWLCLHLERLDIAQLTLEQDSILEKIIVNLRKNGAELLQIEKEKQEELVRQQALKKGGLFGKGKQATADPLLGLSAKSNPILS